jgi:hypothetical protein
VKSPFRTEFFAEQSDQRSRGSKCSRKTKC